MPNFHLIWYVATVLLNTIVRLTIVFSLASLFSLKDGGVVLLVSSTQVSHWFANDDVRHLCNPVAKESGV